MLLARYTNWNRPCSALWRRLRLQRVKMRNDAINMEATETPWAFEDKHEVKKPDVFRMTGSPVEKVVLQLNTRAKSLLVEEYPLAERDLKREDGTWLLRTTINSVEGPAASSSVLQPTSRFFRARSSWTTSRSTTRNTFRNYQPQNLSKMSNLVWSHFWSQFSGLKKLGLLLLSYSVKKGIRRHSEVAA